MDLNLGTSMEMMELFSQDELIDIQREAEKEAQAEIQKLKALEQAEIKKRAREALIQLYKSQTITAYKNESEKRIAAEAEKVVTQYAAQLEQKVVTLENKVKELETKELALKKKGFQISKEGDVQGTKSREVLRRLGVSEEDSNDIISQLRGDESYDEIKEKAIEYEDEKYASEETVVFSNGKDIVDFSDKLENF